MLAVGDVLDAPLRARQLQRASVVGAAQPIAGPALAAQIRERALVDDAPAVDDRHAVAQFLHLGQLVAGEQHRDPFIGQAADQRAHVAHARRIEAGRGLVEHQQARAAQQRRGDPEPLAHPMREAADAMAGARGQLDDLQNLADALLCPIAIQCCQELQVLPRAEVWVEAWRLHEPGDPLERACALA